MLFWTGRWGRSHGLVATDGGCNWMDCTISERNRDIVCRVCRKETEGQHSEVPLNRDRRCNGINDAESSSLDCFNWLCLILRQTIVPNNHTIFKYKVCDTQTAVRTAVLTAIETVNIFGHHLDHLASHSHTCASVTKQYNLVPIAGKWCPTTGKVTVGLASHWPCVTDSSGLSTYGLKA